MGVCATSGAAATPLIASITCNVTLGFDTARAKTSLEAGEVRLDRHRIGAANSSLSANEV
jgi:hypothetical protein